MINFKLNNKNFYERHNKELFKFIKNSKTLQVVSHESKDKIDINNSDIIYSNGNTKDLLNKLESIDKKYEYIIVSDVVETCDDIYHFFLNLSSLLLLDGKLIVSSINPKWTIFIRILEKLNLKNSKNKYSYIHKSKIKGIAEGAGLDFINSYTRQYFPFKIFGLGNLLNKVLESVFFFINFGIKSYIIFRNSSNDLLKYKKSIIIPAKNEEGNLRPLIDRIPKNYPYEIIISCGTSVDNTIEVAHKLKNEESFFNIKVITQSGKGKANAIWESFKVVDGDVIAILDADISVEPETIDDFFNIIDLNHADFVNGTRLIYPMEKGAMRLINQFGNRLFQNLIGRIIKKPITDSLCGTKVFKKELINKIYWWQKEFGLKDPFCDFDLIFSASYFSEKIIEYPVHYKSRVYGKTQISRFRDGFKLIKYLFVSFFIFNSSRN